MKFFRSLLLLPVLALASHAFAHGDHAPPPQIATCKKECGKDEVLEGAKKFLPTLVEKAKFDKSWKDAAVDGAEQKKFGDETEWVVTFKNDKIADKTKQVLYVFVASDGTLAGVNFTGK